MAVSGLKIGASVTKADFDGARNRLLETGAFENVGDHEHGHQSTPASVFSFCTSSAALSTLTPA